MVRRANSIAILLLLAAVFCADALILVRWVIQASVMNGFPLLGLALATLNILGLVLLGRVLVMIARVLLSERRRAEAAIKVAEKS